MASSKCKRFLKKKLSSDPDMVISNLRKENEYLKRSLAELSHQQSQHYKLVERFLSLETERLAEGEESALPSELLSKTVGNLATIRTISATAREMEDIKNRLVSISARCQSLENKVSMKKDSKLDEHASTSSIRELQHHLRDALEKNKQWLEYDQQREAYVREIIARMLWLEKQLNEANQALSKQHNKEHSDERKQMRQMQEYYERLLQKAKDELYVLREQLSGAHQKMLRTQNRYEEKGTEVKELKQQLRSAKVCRESAQGRHRWSDGEERRLRDEAELLKRRLDVERRRSANYELQANLFQKYMLNCHRADQERIAHLERQVNISSEDLKDEKQDCSYLKKQMARVLRMLEKAEDHASKQSKRDSQDSTSCEATPPPTRLSRHSLTSSTHSSLLNESYLECPGCHAEYPASHYRELMNHLETCLD